MNQRQKIELLILSGIVTVTFCFVPMIDMSYEAVVEKPVYEECTTVEPYTVVEEVQELKGGR